MSRSQLRVYRVKPGEMDDWLREWRTRVYPLREQFGFVVVGAWWSADENLFAWVLRYDGPGTFENGDRRYYGSAERAGLTPDPARHLAQVETWLVDQLVLNGP